MSIELRSLNGINNAIQAIEDGEYNDATYLNIRLHHPYFALVWADAYKQQMETLLQAAGKLPKLVSLDIRPVASSVDRCEDCTLHVAAVAAAIGGQATSFTSLTLYMVHLTGTEEDFLKLASAFQGHGKLRHFYLSCKLDCLVDGDSTSNDTSLNLVMTSLGQIPSLETIQLNGGRQLGDLSPTSLASLCQSKFLREFRVVSSILSDEGMAVVTAGLNSKEGAVENLARLSLRCSPLGLKGCKELVQLLSNPRSKLLRIYLNTEQVEKDTDAEELFQKLADGLGNSTCKTIRLQVPSRHKETVLESIKTMLRRNYRIESMQIATPCGEVPDHEIDFLVKTNKLGRGSLFQRENEDNGSTASCSWMSLFETTEDKLDNVFYLVRSHPLEFADMGLRDCDQKMPPTKGEIDAMLRRTKGEIRRSLKHALESISASAVTRHDLDTEFSAHSDYMGENFGDLEILYANSEERTVAKVGDALQKQKEEMEELLSKSEERMEAKVGNVLAEQKRKEQAEIGDAFEEQKKDLQKLLLKSEEHMDRKLEQVHAKSEGHYSKSLIFFGLAFLFFVFMASADKNHGTSQALGHVSYTFGLYNYYNLCVAAIGVQTIGIAWLLFLIYANKTEGMRSALQTFWSVLSSAPSSFGHTTFGSVIHSKTEERIEVNLGDDGIVLEDVDSKSEEGTEANVEKAEAHIETPEANVANDDQEKGSKADIVTTNNNPEAGWSKSKKKRMRQRAKQQKQAEMLYDQNVACLVGAMTKPEIGHE